MVSYAFRDVNVLSGQVRALISGDSVVASISGQAISISGQSISISGQIVGISGQQVEISGQPVSISGQPVTVQSGIWVNIGSGVGVTIAGGTSISGQPIDFVSGIINELSGLNVVLGGVSISLASGTQISITSGIGVTTSISGQLIGISGQQVEISGQPVSISGQAVYISGVVDILSGAFINIGSGIGVIIQSGIDIVKHPPTIIRARPIILVQSGSGGQVLSSGQIQEATIRSLDGNIYIGSATGIDMPMSGVGVLIMQGDSVSVPIDDFSSIRVCAETSGHRVTFGGVY